MKITRQGRQKQIRFLIRYLVHTYFINLQSVLIVYDSKNSTPLKLDYLEAAIDSLKQSPKDEFFIAQWIDVEKCNNEQQFYDIILQNVEMGCQGYISLLPNTTQFLSAKQYATEKAVLRLKDLIFLFLSENEDPKQVLKTELLKLYPNHLFIIPSTPTIFQLWTQQFVGIKNNDEGISIGKFYSNLTFSKGTTDFYRDKIKNMYGRPLKISAVTYIPYVVSYFKGAGEGNVDTPEPDIPPKSVFYIGSEASIILEFCKLRNCTPQVIPYGIDEWGGVYKNGSSNGMIGSVYRKNTEFGIGCYYNWYNKDFETSIAIAKSAVTLLAPAPLEFPPYLTAIVPFTQTVWMAVIASMIIISFIIYAARYFTFSVIQKKDGKIFFHQQCFSRSCLEIVSIFFQQSVPETKMDKLSLRSFLVSIFIAAVILENAYSGNLKSQLTVPKFMDPIDTAEKFAGSDLKWGAPAPAWVLTIMESNITSEQKLRNKFEIRNYDEFRELSFSQKYGLAIERLHSGSYSFGAYIKDDALYYLTLLKDDIFFEYTRGFSVRGWPLMEHFNIFAMWTLEHGLFHVWERKMVAHYLDTKTEQGIINLASRSRENPMPRVLSISHISGFLYSLVIGHMTALFVFILEIIIDRSRKCIERNLSYIGYLSGQVYLIRYCFYLPSSTLVNALFPRL